MLFPVSGISVNPLVPFTVAFLVSFFTSMGGVSGAFLLLPFQMSILGTVPGSPPKSGKPGQMDTVRVTTTSLSRVCFDYDGLSYSFSPVVVYGICFLVGIIGGIYGIGGGSIVAPFFVAIVGLPVFTIAGAALMGTFVTSVAGVGFYHLLSVFYPHMSVEPDWLLGMLFGAGGMLGMYLGARIQKRVPGRAIKGILTFSVLFVALKYIVSFF